MTGPASSDEIGALIAGRYRVDRILGRGGVGIVYRARDERSGRIVALKRCALTDPVRASRNAALLEREYHTLSQLAHPHIIEVFDYGRDQLGPYYTMELLEGADLSNVDVLPWKETCAVLRAVASSLAILHSRGLIHRDVALRNIHRTATGSAKLLDFGAMTSMGVSRDMVGTPPFMAPEVVQLQALDGRADLFSLGAVAYRLLTGRHAFPVRRISELRDAWRSRPRAPALLQPGIPNELNRLVLRLLSLDRGARPQSAAEVIAQLNTIAGLPREDIREISRAYLTTPTLVGRDSQLLHVRRSMLSLVRGDGGVLQIEGRTGSGRSRLLDACALEAKLLSVTVVRADARDARSGDWGVARALGTQLLELFPARAIEAARLSRHILAHVLEELHPDDHTATNEEPERSLVLRELRDWILALAKHHPLAIAVDDAEQIDASSAALLAALANKVERNPILIAITVDLDAEVTTNSSLSLLRELATWVELEDLQCHDTEALVRSLFGDAPNVATCATRIHGLSNGNPRTTIELAQHLVDTGRAVYEGGGWLLPQALDEADLPRTLAASLETRVGMLSPDARELANALALADGTPLRIGSYPALTAHGDSKRAFRALDELVAARILTADAERYSFVQRGLVTVLRESVCEANRKSAHMRIARELSEEWGEPIRRAEHLLAAGEDGVAIELLLKLDLAGQHVPVSLLVTAVESAQRLSLPLATVHRLRVAVLLQAPFSLAADAVVRFAPIVIQQLQHDSGLERYRELAHLPASERLSQALMLTHQAFLATPESERVHAVIDAIRELAQLSGALSAMSVATQSLEMLDILPSLEPLFPLSPTLQIVSQLVEAAKHYVSGRVGLSYALYEQIQKRIDEPDRAGFEDSQYDRVRYGIDYALGLLDARWGAELAEDRASALEENNELRVNAWRIRALMNLARGNVLEGRRCARRAELLEAQTDSKERYGGTTVGIMMVLYASLGDLTGVKATLQTLAALAAKHEGWRPTHMLGKACCAILQGDLLAALGHIEHALEISAGRAWAFVGVALTVRVRILVRLDRREEAISVARAAIRMTRDAQIERTVLGIECAPLLAASGHHDEAKQVLSDLISQAEHARAKGFAMGTVSEAAARVALVEGDVARFEAYMASCTDEYALSRNPALGVRLTSLIDEAREKGIYGSDAQVPVPPSIQPVAINTEIETIHSRIVECIDSSDRGRCVLTLLLQATSSASGYLYGTGEDQRMRLLAALPEVSPDQSIAPWIERCARDWLQPMNLDDVTASADAEQEVTVSSDEPGTLDAVTIHHVDSEGRQYTAIPVHDVAPSGARRLAAVFVPEASPLQGIVLPRTLTLTIARDLIEFGDSAGWTDLDAAKSSRTPRS